MDKADPILKVSQEDELKDLVIIFVGIAVMILTLLLQKYSGPDRTKR